jgi:hypothetical protein
MSDRPPGEPEVVETLQGWDKAELTAQLKQFLESRSAGPHGDQKVSVLVWIVDGTIHTIETRS